jgi:hypothetical protein
MSFRIVSPNVEHFYVHDEEYPIRQAAQDRIAQMPEDCRPQYEVWGDEQIRVFLYDRYAHACRQAMEVQDACNFSGVCGGFYRALVDIRNYLNQYEGGWFGKLQRHPAVVLWIDKINDLMGRPAERGGMEYYSKALDACQAVVKEHAEFRASQEAA